MKNQTITISKISLCLLFASTLVACGGGSSSTTDSGDGSGGGSGGGSVAGGGSGSGGCVNFPRPAVGQIVTRQLKDAAGDVTFTAATEITAISNTSITQKISGTSAGIDIDTTSVDEFTIANNFRDITKNTITQDFGAFAIDTVTSYTPFQRIAVDEVCEGQTWTTTFSEKEDGEAAITRTQVYTIEAVNVSKSSGAGTFNTFRAKIEDSSPEGSFITKVWFDTVSGYDVSSESTDSSGAASFTLEMKDKNF